MTDTPMTEARFQLFVDRIRRSSLPRRLFTHRLFLTGFILFLAVLTMAVLASYIAPHAPNQNNFRYRLGAPNEVHWLGTDRAGRDVLSRIIHGSQVSLRIVNLLRQHCRHLVALVPLECASAATMIALGADRILMGPTAYLTAVDTSLNHALSPVDRDNDRVSVSLDELNRVIRLWRAEQGSEARNPYQSLFEYVHPLVIGAVDRAESLSIMLCRELLAYHIDDAALVDRIATTLNGKYPSHSYPIMLDEARAIGLNVERMPIEINTLLLDLNSHYAEMGQKATTDHDEIRAHGNEILNIWEGTGVQVYYQQDKDWFYRAEERRWVSLNDNSGWRRIERVGNKTKRTVLHVA